MANLALTNPSGPNETVAALVAAVTLDEEQLALTATASSVATLTGEVGTLTTDVTALQAAAAYAKYTAAGAIAPAGRAVLEAGSGAAMTLVNPPADNVALTIVAADAQAYTLTCSSGKLNGGTVGTWTPAIGNSLILLSSGGVWLAVLTNGVAIV